MINLFSSINFKNYQVWIFQNQLFLILVFYFNSFQVPVNFIGIFEIEELLNLVPLF